MGYCLLRSVSVLVHTREGELTAFVFPAANRCLVGWFFATSCGLRISLEAC